MELNKTKIKASKVLRKRLKEFFLKNHSYKDFAKFHKVSQNTICRRACGKRGIPLHTIQEFADNVNENIEDILDGEILSFERSPCTFKFNKEISLPECNFLGWFLSEGHMENEGKRISISQKNKQSLINLKELLKKTFYLTNLRIEKDKDGWKLRISNASFTNYLSWRYSLTPGKKSHIARLPKAIYPLSNEHKLAFLAGYIERRWLF
jgi:hypothetical protein